jgi:thiamine-phosphate pyrophosphorylase
LTEICLQVEASEGAPQRLEAVLAAAAIACVIVEGRNRADVQMLVILAQKRNIAALVVEDAAMAKAVGADGLHLKPGENLLDRYLAARKTLGGEAMIGGDVGASRHDAMELGEAGADYVAFAADGDNAASSPSDVDVEDDAIDLDTPQSQLERAAWWAETFEVPCVALDVADADDAADLAGLNCDFVSIRLVAGRSVTDTAAGVRAIARALKTAGERA